MKVHDLFKTDEQRDRVISRLHNQELIPLLKRFEKEVESNKFGINSVEALDDYLNEIRILKHVPTRWFEEENVTYRKRSRRQIADGNLADKQWLAHIEVALTRNKMEDLENFKDKYDPKNEYSSETVFLMAHNNAKQRLTPFRNLQKLCNAILSAKYSTGAGLPNERNAEFLVRDPHVKRSFNTVHLLDRMLKHLF